MDWTDDVLVVGWILLHVAGLIAAWATRLSAGSRLEPAIQLAFFALLCSLSGVAWCSHQCELGLWIPTGFTMAAMLLTAVTDLRPASEPSNRSAISH